MIKRTYRNLLPIILVFTFTLNGYCAENTGAQPSDKKIFLLRLKQFSGSEMYSYFRTALSRSIRNVMKTKIETVFNEQILSPAELRKNKFTHYITGYYTVKENEITVNFSIFNVITGMETIRAIATGYPDNRIFNLIDNVSGLAVSMIINPPAGSLFKTTTFIIDKDGKIKMKTTRLNREQLQAMLKRIRQSGYDLSTINLHKLDLERINLSGFDLSGLDLQEANLKGANLTGANLTGTRLNGADLSGANLTGAKLYGTDLRGTILKNTNFNNADLRKAKLTEAALNNTSFYGADCSFSDIRSLDLFQCDLTNTYIYCADADYQKIIEKTNNRIWIAPKLLIGLDIGLGMTMHSSRISLINLKVKLIPSMSVNAAITTMYFFKEKIGILFNLGWQFYQSKEEIMEGYNVVTGISYPPAETIGLSFHYLTFGIAPILRLKRKVYIYLGPYAGLRVKSNIPEEYWNMNKIDFGFFLGAFYKFNLSRRLYLSAGLEFRMQIIKWGEKIVYTPGRMMGIYAKISLLYGAL